MAVHRMSEADIADIGMALEMYEASPEGQERQRRFLDSLNPVALTITLVPDDGED